MIFTNPILKIDITEEFTRPHIAAAHASLQNSTKRVNHGGNLQASSFSTACSYVRLQAFSHNSFLSGFDDESICVELLNKAG
ncbi:hypothetical protein, partial [Ensifer sp. Root31]|uniref:hypothetical protein n=1 Tax=Ensifer sp. Root31 TaxID=1736512 RepID=UPI001AECABC0